MLSFCPSQPLAISPSPFLLRPSDVHFVRSLHRRGAFFISASIHAAFANRCLNSNLSLCCVSSLACTSLVLPPSNPSRLCPVFWQHVHRILCSPPSPPPPFPMCTKLSKSLYVAAVACLKRASCLDPFEWIVSYNLGLVHLNTSQYASAFHHFRYGSWSPVIAGFRYHAS